jgi:two-component system response regulator LytT
MYTIRILEDEDEAASSLTSSLSRYAEEHGLELQVERFKNAYDFLESYKPGMDLLFFDIEMPGMNGMEAAKKVRAMDPTALIVFVTNLAQYAIEGYAVCAFDFVLKPVRYGPFSLKLDRIFHELAHHHSEGKLVLNMKGSSVAIPLDSLLYVEIRNHDLIYHLEDGKTYKLRGTMAKAKEELADHHFSLCNACYLVNLKFVSGTRGNAVLVHDEELAISQGKRKEFMMDLASYFGGSV